MRFIIDKILWGMLLVFFGPTIMIVASWNALPGDNLYGMKLALERTALALASPSYTTTGSLQIKYTERRFAETKQLLASKQSIQGLPYLEQQIAQTKKSIENAPNKETQVALAKQYINTLSTVSTELEQEKQTITTSPPPIAYAPAPPTVTPTPRPTETPPARQDLASPETPTSTPTPQPTPTPTPVQIAQVTTTVPIPTQHAVVALQIDQTQQNVAATIADLQALVKEDDHDSRNEQKLRKNKGRDENDRTKKNDNESDGNRRGKKSETDSSQN